MDARVAEKASADNWRLWLFLFKIAFSAAAIYVYFLKGTLAALVVFLVGTAIEALCDLYLFLGKRSS